MAVPKKRSTPRRPVRLDALAEQYDVHPKTLRSRIADGTMSGYLMAGKGRALFLDQDEVDEKLFRQVPTVERSA